jgi:hypothetical protein
VEQRKRLTIAVELVANPSIVFMDEPTSGDLAPLGHSGIAVCAFGTLNRHSHRCCSFMLCSNWLEARQSALFIASTAMYALAGLDARAAAIVMRAVRNTVNTGRTVVCTIHQPSIDVFEVQHAPVSLICVLWDNRIRVTAEISAYMCACSLEVQSFCLYHCRPSVLTALLQSFDELLLMKRGGRIIFNGPLGARSSDLISFFLVCSHQNMCSNVMLDMLWD